MDSVVNSFLFIQIAIDEYVYYSLVAFYCKKEIIFHDTAILTRHTTSSFKMFVFVC